MIPAPPPLPIWARCIDWLCRDPVQTALGLACGAASVLLWYAVTKP